MTIDLTSEASPPATLLMVPSATSGHDQATQASGAGPGTPSFLLFLLFSYGRPLILILIVTLLAPMHAVLCPPFRVSFGAQSTFGLKHMGTGLGLLGTWALGLDTGHWGHDY